MALELEEEPERILEDVREVSGTEEGFLGLVASDVLPMPELMSFNEWSSWRSGDGRRPRRVHGDPRTTTQGEEATLWRRTMEIFYGTDWRVDLSRRQDSEALAAFREDEEEERGSPGMPRGSPAARGPGPPATSAGSPGMDVLARRNAALPRGAGSGAGSSGSSGAVTPVSLRRQIEQEYDPSQESREDWQGRVLRGVAQLERLGQASQKTRWKSWFARLGTQKTCAA